MTGFPNMSSRFQTGSRSFPFLGQAVQPDMNSLGMSTNEIVTCPECSISWASELHGLGIRCDSTKTKQYLANNGRHGSSCQTHIGKIGLSMKPSVTEVSSEVVKQPKGLSLTLRKEMRRKLDCADSGVVTRTYLPLKPNCWGSL